MKTDLFIIDSPTIALSCYVKRKKHFENLNINNITHNKLFWQAVCPLFSEKHISKISKSHFLKKKKKRKKKFKLMMRKWQSLAIVFFKKRH